MSAATIERAAVPEQWQALGFSGLFQTEASIEPGTADLWRSRVPCRLPLGGNGGWLALRVHDDCRSVTIVRQDAAAICDVTIR